MFGCGGGLFRPEELPQKASALIKEVSVNTPNNLQKVQAPNSHNSSDFDQKSTGFTGSGGDTGSHQIW